MSETPYESLVKFINMNGYGEEREQALLDLQRLSKLSFVITEYLVPQTFNTYSTEAKDKLKVEMRFAGLVFEYNQEFYPGQLDDEGLREYVVKIAKRELVDQLIKKVSETKEGR